MDAELIARTEGARFTFGRVLVSGARRVVVDVCGVALTFAAHSGRALDPRAAGYALLPTTPPGMHRPDVPDLAVVVETRPLRRRAPRNAAEAPEGHEEDGAAPEPGDVDAGDELDADDAGADGGEGEGT
jgi:hypothetical protein